MISSHILHRFIFNKGHCNMEKIKLPKDNPSFSSPEAIPSSPKKFKQSSVLTSFYRFIYENDLRKEALQHITQILLTRKAEKIMSRKAQKR